MKKFTRNFLFVEHGFGNVLRKIGLSMVAILMAVGAFAQAQGTYHVFAEDVEDCYRGDNTYEVIVSMRDFVRIDSLNLIMTYDDDFFTLDSYETLVDELDAGSGLSVTNIAATGLDSLEFVWDSGNDPQTIQPNNDTTAVIKLVFSLKGVPHAQGSLLNFNTDLAWIQAESSLWNWDSEDQTKQILTWDYTDGSIDVTQSLTPIVVETFAADCDGGQAIAAVVSPTDEDMMYSWNGNTFTSDSLTTINDAPTEGTVRVMLDGCVSYTDTFSVDAADPFSFDVEETTVEVDCPGGDGDLEIEALGGDGNYTYFVVSDDDILDVYADFAGKSNNQAIDYLIDDNYDSSNPVIQLPEGTYYVMVVDGNHCQDVRIEEDWIEVVVVDNKDAWSIDNLSVTAEQCHGFENGALSFDISGATPFVDGYTVIAPAGVTVDSPAFTVDLDELAPGDYEFTFVDSLSCQYTTAITVDPAQEIEFDIVYTDASCGDSTGTIALTGDFVNSLGDTLTLAAAADSGYTFVLSQVPDFSTTVGEWDVDVTAANLAADVYYMRVYQDGYTIDGCYEDYENENADNAIKLLDVDIEAHMNAIYCGGDSAKTAWIDIDNPPSGDVGVYKYAVNYINSVAPEVFVPADSVLTGPGGTTIGFEGDTTYIFTVWDTVADCSFTIPYDLLEPDSLNIEVVEDLTYEPTCHDANDGDIQVQGSGGTTFAGYSYEYKFDDRPWDTGGISNVFAADTGMHVIYIRDAVGCIDSVEFNLSLTPNVIDVYDENDVDANTYEADTTWLECNSDTILLYADTLSWIHEPAGTNQGEREPKMYWGTSTDDISTLLTDTTNAFTAGVYYFQGVDEWGCVSNVDTFVVWEPEPLVAEASWYADAGCEGTNSGVVMIEAWNQDSTQGYDPRYQYAFTQSAAIMQQADWYDQVNWIDFHNDDTDNDSVVFVRNLPEGEYYVGVRYVCAMENDGVYRDSWYYKTMSPIEIGQIDAIDVDWTAVDVEAITCNVMGEDPAMDGSVTGLYDALEGGSGGFEFEIDLLTAYERYDVDDLPDFPMDNMTGDFTGLPAGDYMLTVEDSTGCTYMEEFTIENNFFYAETEVIYASCNDSHDGIIRFIIEGGKAPFEETTNNVGMYEDPSEIPAVRWNAVDTTTNIYDRLVQAGDYKTYIRDANGCIYEHTVVTVEEPEEFTMVVDSLIVPTCAVADQASEASFGDGEIWLEIGGGWASDEDNFEYIVTIGALSDTVDYGEIAKFEGLGSGSYTVKVTERNDTLAAMPIFKYSDYYESWDTISMPYQNPDTACYTTFTVELGGPDPLDYVDIEYTPEQCYNTPTGEIYLYGISGGTGPYTVWVEGPDAYRPLNEGVGEEIPLGRDEAGAIVTEYTWDDLTWGHYTVYIEDSVGCVLVRESGEIERPDSLMITNTELIENALCNGGNGIVEIHAEGGVAPYEYALVSADNLDVAPEDLDWQNDPVFEVPAGIYIAWVVDSVGCETGFPSENGTVLTQHRVTVLEPDPIEIDVADTEDALCYGAENGIINVDTIYGGNGAAWTVIVSGTAYDGTEISKTYLNVASADAVLDSLYASTTKTRDSVLTEEDYYWITVYDDEGCESAVDSAVVYQPEEFVVDLIANTDAFICPDDLAGVFEMQVLSGGTPFNGIEGRFEFKWQAYADSAMTELVRETDWGFTKDFQGAGNLYYYVQARDVNGCVTDTMKFIDGPDPIEFDVQNITCNGDSMASARVSILGGTEGRSYRVWYEQIEGDHANMGLVSDSVWFTESHDLIQKFIFDDDDITDSRYRLMIEDELGCTSVIDTVTFDPVQHPLALDVAVVDDGIGECSSLVDIKVDGGIEPYVITMDGDSVIAEGMYDLPAGTYEFTVTDAHLRCEDMVTVVVETMPVMRDTMIETYIGYPTDFVDVESGIDTTLNAGDYTFTYMGDECYRTLNVEVVPVPREADIVTVQSEADASEWVGDTVQVTGTVTAVVEGEGFFMQDANAAWSGIWVAYTTTGDLEIGDGATVVGEVAEVADVTTINASTVTEITAPIAIAAIPVEPMDAEAEMYESVLVIVEGAKAMALDTTSGEWVVYTEDENDVVVNDWMYAYEPTEGHFYDVTGVVNGLGDAYLVEPRMESDVVDLTATITDPELKAVDFKVYPNPFNDHIKIDNNDKLTRVVVSNIAGQRVMDVEYPSHEIRTANLVSGVYVVSMFTEDGLAKTERIVKR